MPLNTGPNSDTPAGIQENIERMIAEGKSVEEAVALAYQVAKDTQGEKDGR